MVLLQLPDAARNDRMLLTTAAVQLAYDVACAPPAADWHLHELAMDLCRGFTLKEPAVTIPFGMSPRGLQQLLGERVRRITNDYYCLSCTSLGGLQHELGCHFKRGLFRRRLNELEFFRKAYPDQFASFNEFQRHFEASFGPPTETTPGSAGFLNHHGCFPVSKLCTLCTTDSDQKSTCASARTRNNRRRLS